MSSILDIIKHYQKSIESSSKDESRLLHCIKKLSEMRVTVEHLQQTGIGKTVNSLRKCSGETGLAARALVTKWKAMVAAEEEAMDTSGDESHNGKNYEDSGTDDDKSGDQRNRKYSVNDNSDHQHHRTHTQLHQKQKDSNKHSESGTNNKHSSRSSSHHSNSQSHHNSSPSKHRANSGQNLERKADEKHHSSREEREKKSEHKEREKDKRKEEKTEDKHKSSSSTKREGSKDEANHNREKDTKHRGSDKQASSKDKEKHDCDHQTKSKEKKRDKSKSSSKEKEHRDKQKSSSSTSSKTTTLAVTTNNSDATPSTSRKRNINDENDSNEAISPKMKKPKNDKVAKIGNDEDVDNGIDSSMGANFADVLGMLNIPTKKSKKLLNTQKSPIAASTSSTSSAHIKHSNANKNINSHTKFTSSSVVTSTASTTKRSPDEKPDLLSPTAKLEPLDPSIALELPPISTNYKPLPRNQIVMDCVFKDYATPSAPKPMVRTLTDAEALSHGISSKTMRTKIYSGVKTGQILQVPSLFDLCIRILQKNIDGLEYTGGVPFEVLRPVIDRATPQQLLTFEEYNPYVMEESDALWQMHVQRNYRSQKRKEMESWREMFLRCQEEEERKLIKLAEGIKQSQKIIAAPVRKTQLAFVDSMVKPPRNVQRKQEQYGTKAKLIATPAARVAALSSVTPNAAKSGDVRLRVAASMRDAAQVTHTSVRPKKAPLMAKTLQFIRGRKKR